jgi:hypothetical protein
MPRREGQPEPPRPPQARSAPGARVRHHREVPLPPAAGQPDAEAPDGSETCPGCGAVLAALPDVEPAHPGASASCARLFEVTVRGLREESSADPATAPLVRLADAAYDAQHPVATDPDRLAAALDQLAETLGTRPAVSNDAPHMWRTTIADAAADLDVIDLRVLVEAWAREVQADWRA